MIDAIAQFHDRERRFGGLQAGPRREPTPIAPAWRREGTGAVGNELALRVVSAIALITVSLLLAWASLWSFAALVLLCSMIATWEWGRVVRGESFGPILFSHGAAVAFALLLTTAGMPILGLAALAAGIVAVALLARLEPMPVCHRRRHLFGPAGHLPGLSALGRGLWLACDPVCVFGGLVCRCRGLCGRAARWRAASGARISPNKTCSGAVAGLAASGVVAFGFGHWMGGSSPILLALVGICLSAISQLGDLAESSVKRSFHVKDAGHLIPGHGGMLDRIDALLFASVAAGLLAAMRQPGVSWPSSLDLAVKCFK